MWKLEISISSVLNCVVSNKETINLLFHPRPFITYQYILLYSVKWKSHNRVFVSFCVCVFLFFSVVVVTDFGASQLVLASEASDSVDGEGQPSNVLVHKLGVPPAQNEAGGGVGAAAPPTRGLLLDQRRYANISRYELFACREGRRGRKGYPFHG